MLHWSASTEPFKISYLARSDQRQHVARSYIAVANSKRLLSEPLPTVFLGQKHYAPFALPDEVEHCINWSSRFRRRADECRALAKIAADEAMREGYRKLAEMYEQMARASIGANR